MSNPTKEQQLTEEQQLAVPRAIRKSREGQQRNKTRGIIAAAIGLMIYALYHWLFHK
jgi:hypothetical protein